MSSLVPLEPHRSSTPITLLALAAWPARLTKMSHGYFEASCTSLVAAGRAARACYAPRTFHANYSWATYSSCLLRAERMIGIGAWTRHPHATDVAVHDVDRNAVPFAEPRAELVGDHYRTMPATGAPDGDGRGNFSPHVRNVADKIRAARRPDPETRDCPAAPTRSSLTT